MRFGSAGGTVKPESSVRFKLRDKSRAELPKGIILEASDLQFSIQTPNSRLGLQKRHGQTLVRSHPPVDGAGIMRTTVKDASTTTSFTCIRTKRESEMSGQTTLQKR